MVWKKRVFAIATLVLLVAILSPKFCSKTGGLHFPVASASPEISLKNRGGVHSVNNLRYN